MSKPIKDPRVKIMVDLFRSIGIKYSHHYQSPRHGGITLKVHHMRSPSAAECKLLMDTAYKLGATAAGFKRSAPAWIPRLKEDPMYGWSFIVYLPARQIVLPSVETQRKLSNMPDNTFAIAA